MTCPGIVEGDAFVVSLLGAADCHARAVATLGYQALATPGSSASLLLTGMLTLFVAIWGYRMLLGETPGVRDGVVALAKVGIVLALATSWATYRPLAHDLVFGAPGELVAEVGGAAGLPGTLGDRAVRLGYVDRALVRLGEAGVGKREGNQQVMRQRNINGRNELVVENAQDPVGVIEPIALAASRVLFLISTLGGLVILRFAAAILLALGPIFVAFLLFDATRGWFAGWLRGLMGTMIASFGVAILLGIELALLEPWVASLVARRAGEQTISGAPVELLAVTAIFALAMLGSILFALKVATGLRLPEAWRAVPERINREVEQLLQRRNPATTPAGEPAAERSRAAAVADAVVAIQRRETGGATPITAAALGAGLAPVRSNPGERVARDQTVAAPPPLGQRATRRGRNRVTASAGRRDQTK
ncbi:MAG: type IV secretion system protein [Sphingomonas sp.]